MSSRRGALLVIVLILAAVTVSAGGLLVLAFLGGAPPTVPDRATLRLRLEAPFSEIEASDVVSQVLGRSPTLRATIDLIRRAKTDTRITAIIVRPAGTGVLWAQLQEMRAALVDFHKSGKPVIAYLESGAGPEYYVATGASRIVMMPAGQLDLTGVASYELFFRNALDKVGVFPDMLHIGDYKTLSNTFTEKTFTPAHREMTESLNREWYEQLIGGVAEGRRLSADAARAAIDGGPYLADGAKRAGLVDELAYEDQLDAMEPVKGTSAIDAEQYARALTSEISQPGGRIALLYAVGTIASGKSSFDSPAGLVIGSDTFNAWLRKVRLEPAVRAVVVRINSPGGSAIASEAIWRELLLTRDVKPVVVSMGDVAASGGYYIAAPAHSIVAEPGTLTGSIGVVTGKFVLDGAAEKLGVGTGAVANGPFAGMNSPFRPYSPAERARIEEQMQTTYELFLTRVAEGRREAMPKIDAVAQGRVWTGRQARGLGLVDELGGLDDALRIAKERAKLDPAKRVELLVYPPKRSLYEVLTSSLSGSSEMTAARAALGGRDMGMLDSTVSNLRLFRRGEPLALMPNVFFRP